LNEEQSNSITPEQKYCSDCGSIIFRKAEICPKCGCRQLPARASLFSSSPLIPQIRVPTAQADIAAPDTGKMATLFVCNFLWSGLGNLAIGDKRGWGFGFFNWLVFVLSIFTFWLPSLLYFGFCSWQGYQFLQQQQTHQTSGSGEGLVKR
jgi:hypothetical protein